MFAHVAEWAGLQAPMSIAMCCHAAACTGWGNVAHIVVQDLPDQERFDSPRLILKGASNDGISVSEMALSRSLGADSVEANYKNIANNPSWGSLIDAQPS